MSTALLDARSSVTSDSDAAAAGRAAGGTAVADDVADDGLYATLGPNPTLLDRLVFPLRVQHAYIRRLAAAFSVQYILAVGSVYGISQGMGEGFCESHPGLTRCPPPPLLAGSHPPAACRPLHVRLLRRRRAEDQPGPRCGGVRPRPRPLGDEIPLRDDERRLADLGVPPGPLLRDLRRARHGRVAVAGV